MLKNLVTFGTEIPLVEDMEINHTYVLTLADGIYRYKRTPLMLFKEKQETFENTLVGLSTGSEGVELLIPKVPFKLWLMSLDFFKDIYDKYETEASTIIYHIQDMDVYNEFYKSLTSKEKSSILVYKDFLIHAPLQENERLETNFGDCPLYNKLCDKSNYIKVIELHSHHVMDTFWSGTDNRNQNEDCFYGVYGKLGEEDNFLMKYVIQGANVDTTVDKLFHFPKLNVTTSYEVDKYKKLIGLDIKPKVKTYPFEGVFPNNSTYPKEWLDMVTVVGERQNETVNRVDKVINNNEGTNTAEEEALLYTLSHDLMVGMNYRTLNTLQPDGDDLSIYNEEENLKIMEYLLYTHRLLAINYLLHYLNKKDYTDIENDFKDYSERLEKSKNQMVELGYITKEDSNGMLANFYSMINLTHLYFYKVADTFPKLNVPNLADKYLISLAI